MSEQTGVWVVMYTGGLYPEGTKVADVVMGAEPLPGSTVLLDVDGPRYRFTADREWRAFTVTEDHIQRGMRGYVPATLTVRVEPA